MMKKPRISVELPYKVRKASEMSQTELTRWFALMNMLKFINYGENICRTKKSEEDIHQRCMERYINDTAGDLARYLKDYGGIPFKFSLNPKHQESKHLGEIDLVFSN